MPPKRNRRAAEAIHSQGRISAACTGSAISSGVPRPRKTKQRKIIQKNIPCKTLGRITTPGLNLINTGGQVPDKRLKKKNLGAKKTRVPMMKAFLILWRQKEVELHATPQSSKDNARANAKSASTLPSFATVCMYSNPESNCCLRFAQPTQGIDGKSNKADNHADRAANAEVDQRSPEARPNGQAWRLDGRHWGCAGRGGPWPAPVRGTCG